MLDQTSTSLVNNHFSRSPLGENHELAIGPNYYAYLDINNTAL